MSIDVMKQALEALEGFIPYLPLDDEAQCNRYDKAITSLRAAIEQAQEPVAWVWPSLLHQKTQERQWLKAFSATEIDGWIPLYTAPRQWQGLTGEEIEQCCYEAFSKAADHPQTWKWTEAFARAIEAKLREKNT